MDSEKIIIKPLKLNELIISLERLIRFKRPYHKKSRVYKDILTKNTIYPKISLKNYSEYPLGIINALVQLIWNYSIKNLCNNFEQDYRINTYLAYEELKVFSSQNIIEDIIFSENTLKFSTISSLSIKDSEYANIVEILNDNFFKIEPQNFIDNSLDALSIAYLQYNLGFPLNIDGLLSIIKDDFPLSSNIKRLIHINHIIKTENLDFSLFTTLEKMYKKAENQRKIQKAKYPVKLILLVEGATEEKLLPVFSNKLGINFDEHGIELIASGGKNQVDKLYDSLYQIANLPILIILDKDAMPVAEKIKMKLRKKDRLFVIPEGEFEDILPVNLICKTVNKHYRLLTQISPDDLTKYDSMSSCLETIWKEKGIGEFSKAEFARILSENIHNKEDISPTLQHIVEIIRELL